MKRASIAILAVIMLLAHAVGCASAQQAGDAPAQQVEAVAPQGDNGQQEGAGAATETDKEIVIGLSEPSSGWPYIYMYMVAFQKFVDETPGVRVIQLSADGDIQKQANDIDDLIVQGVDIILVCSLDGTAIVPSLAKARAANIPILAVSNEPDEEGQKLIEGYCGPDDKEQGRIAARIMAEALGGVGKVCIVEGKPGQSTTQLRSDGFKEVLAEIAPGIEIIAEQPCDWDPAKAKSVAQTFITQFGDEIDGIFAQDDNIASAVGEVVRDANLGKEIIIVGTGGSQNGINAIREGLIYGTMMQSPTIDAENGLALALKIVNGEPLPEKRNIIPMPIVTPDNAYEYDGEW